MRRLLHRWRMWRSPSYRTQEAGRQLLAELAEGIQAPPLSPEEFAEMSARLMPKLAAMPFVRWMTEDDDD